jgi:hypothetical protein
MFPSLIDLLCTSLFGCALNFFSTKTAGERPSSARETSGDADDVIKPVTHKTELRPTPAWQSRRQIVVPCCNNRLKECMTRYNPASERPLDLDFERLSLMAEASTNHFCLVPAGSAKNFKLSILEPLLRRSTLKCRQRLLAFAHHASGLDVSVSSPQ